MRMLKRAWFVAAVVTALVALVAGSLTTTGSPVTRLAGVLVIVAGLMPVALMLAGPRHRRRRIGVLHVAAGALFGTAGFVLASHDDLVRLRMDTINWRILVTSGPGLASVGWMALGLALILTGSGLFLSRRAGAVLSCLVVLPVSSFFTASLALVPYLRLRRLGHIQLDEQAMAAAFVFLLVALLLVIAAFSSYPVTWTPMTPDLRGNPRTAAGARPRPSEIAARGNPDEMIKSHGGRRWVKPAGWTAVGLVAVAGTSIWVWSTWGPRVVLAEAFPDPNLASCVADKLGVSGGSARVSQHDLATVLSLTCNGDHVEWSVPGSGRPGHQLEDLARTRIGSIRGLDALPNLATLGLQNNAIHDLTPLTGLHKLAKVTLTHNQVSDLAPLAGLPALTNLGLSDNAIADLTPLAHVRTLRFLGLSGNQISDLAPLAGLVGLDTLDAGDNRVSDVAPLAHLPQLSRLTLTANRIVSPAPLRDLPALVMLNIAGNRIADATTFAGGFRSLEELWAGGNLLTDVSPLVALPKLTGVDLDGAQSGKMTGMDVLRAHNIYVGRA